jgi:exopolysaccharide biosynthesis protein
MVSKYSPFFNKILFAWWLGALMFSVCTGFSQGQSINKIADWNSKQVQENITWRSRYFTDLFGSKEFINLLDIDLNDTSIKPFIAWQDTVLLTTHEMAEREKAVAAVNGNFFHTKNGGSVCFLKINGKIIDTSRTDLSEHLFLDELDDAAIIIDREGKMGIISCPPAGWKSITQMPTIISAGPPLILEGKTVKFISNTFNDKRFSRTGAGLTKNNHLLLITVDGNSEQSAGMTIAEFAQIFKAFNCINALNLDGGGSTTMWIKGEPDSGIVNHPTDNKKFDHYGETKIANAIILK